MAFTRANPFGFFKTDTLTSAQANQMDLNISNGIDKRDGYSDTISSTLTVDGYGSMTFASGSDLVIQDPASITIGTGNLACGAAIIGDSIPLRFGYSTEAVTSTTHTVSSASYINHIIKLTGTLTGATSVILPTLSGYDKIINNSTSDGYNLTVKTVAGTGPIIPYNKCAYVYCDGVNIVSAIIKPSNTVESILAKGSTSSNYGDSMYANDLAVYNDVTGYLFAMPLAKAGDIFEITYTAGLINDSAGGTSYIAVANTQDGIMQETEFIHVGDVQATATLSTQFTCSIDYAVMYIALQAKTDNVSHPGDVCAPLSIVIKQIRK